MTTVGVIRSGKNLVAAKNKGRAAKRLTARRRSPILPVRTKQPGMI